MNAKLENAKRLYLEGIRDGHYEEAVHKYTGDRYTQHSTGVKDGKEGFIEFFREFTTRNPDRDIQIVRGWADGQYVFLQAYQNINNGHREWVTTDFFDTDEQDRIIEHWDVIARYAPQTPSGHTSVDGPTEITDLDKTEANKATVRALMEQVLMRGGDLQRVDEFIAEEYIQHNATVADGRDAFKEKLFAPDRKLWYDEIVLQVGQGNFVATLSKASFGEQAYAQVDIFRLENGKIVEHWDNAEPVPEVNVNGGKF
ncbi:MAG: nuclear transport factor 2 family protein [Bacteroidota bacterium]